MKPITTPKDSAPRPATALGTSASDLEAQLSSLADEERSLQERKARLRQTFWETTVASVRSQIDTLLQHDFDRPQIAKALGLSALPAKTPAGPKGTGPTTYEGWLSLFRATGVRAFIKSHPDLAATLKAQQVSPADYATHIPPADLKSIETEAAKKARAKSPNGTGGEKQQ